MKLRSICLYGAILATSAPAPAAAEGGVTVVCGSGHTTTVRGFTIDGTQTGWPVLFEEDSVECGAGEPFPDALSLSIQQPAEGSTVTVSSGTKHVNFAATIANFTASADVCRVRVFPPAPLAGWPPTTLVPNANGIATTTITFVQGIVYGAYRLQLSCQRTISGQQIVVQPVERNVTVN